MGQGKERVTRFLVASDPVSHIKNHIGYTGKGSVLNTFNTGHVLEAEIQQLLYQTEYWASLSEMLVLTYCLYGMRRTVGLVKCEVNIGNTSA